jgi:hypothetical protein
MKNRPAGAEHEPPSPKVYPLPRFIEVEEATIRLLAASRLSRQVAKAAILNGSRINIGFSRAGR